MSKKSKTLSDIDCVELCSLLGKGHASAQKVTVTNGSNGLVGSFVEDPLISYIY